MTNVNNYITTYKNQKLNESYDQEEEVITDRTEIKKKVVRPLKLKKQHKKEERAKSLESERNHKNEKDEENDYFSMAANYPTLHQLNAEAKSKRPVSYQVVRDNAKKAFVVTQSDSFYKTKVDDKNDYYLDPNKKSDESINDKIKKDDDSEDDYFKNNTLITPTVNNKGDSNAFRPATLR